MIKKFFSVTLNFVHMSGEVLETNLIRSWNWKDLLFTLSCEVKWRSGVIGTNVKMSKVKKWNEISEVIGNNVKIINLLIKN